MLDGEPVTPSASPRPTTRSRPYVELVDARQRVPLSFFEVLVGMAYALFADAPVDVAVVEVGMGGPWDATNVADAPGRRGHPGRPRPREYLGPDVEHDRRREGRDHQARRDRGAGRTSSRRRAERWSGAPSSSSAASPARASSSACWRAGSPSAGSRCGCRGWAASTTRCSCRCTARTRRTTRRPRSPRSRRSSAPGAADRPDRAGDRPGGVRRASPRPAGSRWCAAARPCWSTPRTTRPGVAATVDAIERVVPLPPAGRRGRRESATRTSAACSRRSRTCSTRSS